MLVLTETRICTVIIMDHADHIISQDLAIVPPAICLVLVAAMMFSESQTSCYLRVNLLRFIGASKETVLVEVFI